VERERNSSVIAALPREIAKDVEAAVDILRRHGARRIPVWLTGAGRLPYGFGH